MNSRPAVVLLSAGSSKEKMPGFPVYKTSPAFMPVNSRSLGKIVIDFYLSENAKSIYLVVNESDYSYALEEFGCYGDAIKILGVSETKSILDTIEQTLPAVMEDDVLINIVTTIPQILIPEKNCIGLNERITGIEGWAGVQILDSEMKFITKRDNKGETGYSFSGIFRADKNRILNATRDVKNGDRRDLISVIEKLHTTQPMSVIHFSWSDCGHIQNYFKTRQKIIGSRFFNSIAIDSSKGVLTKSSSNCEKLVRESKYVQSLPVDLSVYFPRILKLEESKDLSKVTMEYYAYPALAEIMLYWDLPKSIWVDIFAVLGKTLSHFNEYPGAFYKGDWREIYVTKLKTRVEEYSHQLDVNNYSLLFESEQMSINGVRVYSWKMLCNYLEEVLMVLEDSRDCRVVHGDFCCNNILCEPYSGIVKLIDARGSFGDTKVGIYGDRKYDWAKLGHSVVGRYDYIVNDLFKIDSISGQFHVRTFDRPWQKNLDELFWAEFEKTGLSKGMILFIIGSLFISMPPLHADNKNRQLAFFLKGVMYLNEGLASLGRLRK